MFLGQGSYGEVTLKNGKAIKKFSKLSHLIQEYMALEYLHDCKYVVHAAGVDFAKLELHMEAYDGSLRKWIEDKKNKRNFGNNNRGANKSEVMSILRDILMGLVELHDRDLAHGDLKPGNILVNYNPLRTVLGDCGFVSIAKYAKVERTAAVYRDPVIEHSPTHDMFSFGICCLELLGGVKMRRQANYHELKNATKTKITDKNYRKLICSLLQENKSKRPTSREVLMMMFNESPPRWERSKISISSSELGNSQIFLRNKTRLYIRKLMKETSRKYDINRPKKGYGALLYYLDSSKASTDSYKFHTAITLMILSAMFGRSGFRENEVFRLCDSRYSKHDMYQLLEQLIKNNTYVNILLSP